MFESTTGRAPLLLCRTLVVALFFLSSRTPSIASTTAFSDGKKPKPSKRGLPAATVRVAVAQVAEKEGDEPRLLSAATFPLERWGSVPACVSEAGLRSRLTAPEYLKPYTPSHADTFLWPPVPGRARSL